MPSYTQYMRQMAVLDANDDDIESWITVKGNHIPIKKGQSKEDAVKSFIEKKGGKEKGGDYESQGRETAKREASHEFKKRSGVGLKFTELGKGDHGSEKKSESKYDPEFETVRKNALANSSLYGGRYTQKSKAEAYKAYKKDTEKKAPNGQTIGQLRESGKDVGKLDKAMQYVYYGFKEEKGNKMSPQQLLDFLEERVKESDKDKNFGDRWAKSRFPEAIKLVKEYINGTEKKAQTPAQQHTTTRNIMTLFSKHYEDLYDGKTKYNRELVKEFDSKMANDPEFKKQVQAFVRERGDVLSSDREVQAYMMAYNHSKSKSEPIMEKLESYHNGNKG